MNFTQSATPYVNKKMKQANDSFSNHDLEAGFKALEDAHVIGQHSTYHHTVVHYQMLKFGLKQRDNKEVFGQIIRIMGALTKTAIGLLPEGNTGGANVNPFKPMPISPENKAILNQIRQAKS
ncbi:DUF3703 domain-containing protein [Glaciecola petra]|uniref:DUF3703 domain-containing protein n=1 Tax=Glaciecola petra TaxID=3075602 RepID=A0ABU2ZS34_9ALTE|nr:DUF3703 domain-containing protein [Aestuariibacter sp. P117]MDT0595437.1 DUF3703 domain-containing protein [Aestuariibacter sp. P117]